MEPMGLEAGFAAGMAADMALRGFVAAYFAMLAVAYSAKQMALQHRDGAAPIHRAARGEPGWLGRRAFEATRIAILALMAARAVAPEVDALLGAFRLPAPLAFGGLGAVLMLGGAWQVFYAHNYMGAIWRSGTPGRLDAPTGPDALLQRGPFARSRNPIFLGVLVAHLGLVLAAPSLFTLACLALCAAALLRQVAIEEQSLASRFGPSYAAYRARTPRWI